MLLLVVLVVLLGVLLLRVFLVEFLALLLKEISRLLLLRSLQLQLLLVG
jgi:hypothetical protein